MTAFRLLLPFALLLAAQAHAATYTVATLGGGQGSCDGTACSTIRAAVAAANATQAPDEIVFAHGLAGEVALGESLLIDGNLRELAIDGDSDGDGRADITLSGQDLRPVFYLQGAAIVQLSHLNIVHGYTANAGGGISLQPQVQLRIRHSTLAHNRARHGGAIGTTFSGANHSVVTLLHSTLTDNEASENGGALYLYRADAHAVHSTISGNRAASGGGAALVQGSTLELGHATLSGNRAVSGGGLYLSQGSTATLKASAVAGSPEGGDCVRYLNNATLNASHSLVQDGSCGVAAGSDGNLTGDPGLAALADNGGATSTHFPAWNSALIDAVDCDEFAGLDTAADQRGHPRHRGSRCDIGAVEGGDMIVTTQADETTANGACSLREAIANANGNSNAYPECGAGSAGSDLIRFASNVTHIVLGGGQMNLANAGKLHVDGARADGGLVAIDGNAASRVFHVDTGATADLHGLAIVNGQSGDGGGLYNGGTLRLSACTLSGNAATSGSRAGGAIYNATGGALSIVRCTLSGNVADNDGGAIENNGALSIAHSTLSGNRAQVGGGIDHWRGSLTLEHVTLAGNRGTNGAGLYVGMQASGTTLTASVLAGNIDGSDCQRQTSSVAIQAQGNFIGHDSCATGSPGGDAGLAPLARHGGPTQTHLPLPGSPLIDAVDCSGLDADARDQRGVIRPQGARCDIGAVEYRGTVLVTATDGGHTADGQCSLREAIGNANAGTQVHADCALRENLVRFAANVDVINLGGAELAITAPYLGIDGAGGVDGRVFLSGNLASRLLRVAGGVQASAANLALALGNSGNANGGGVWVQADAHLALSDCQVAGNSSNAAGAGIYNQGTLELTRCLVAQNQAAQGGGGVMSLGAGTHTAIAHSTISSNTAGSTGGGVWSNGEVSLRFSSLAGNRAQNTPGDLGGGALFLLDGTATLHASVLADSPAGGDCQLRNSAQVIATSSLIEDGACITAGQNGNLAGDPALGALTAFGNTSVHLPLPGGPLADAVACAGAADARDQRGIARPQGARCDLGAAEARQRTLGVSVAGQGSVSAAATPAPQSGGISACAGSGGDCSAAYLESAASTTLTATPATGWHFVQWGNACAGTGAGLSVALEADKHCTAAFAINLYAIAASVSPAGVASAQCAPQQVEHGGSSVCSYGSIAEGYEFAGWSGDCSGATCTLENITGARSVTAHFALKTYAVTLDADANGTLALAEPAGMDPDAVPHGTALVFAATPQPGHVLRRLHGCGGADEDASPFATAPITGACTITARFVPIVEVSVHIDNHRRDTRPGDVLEYDIAVRNDSAIAVNGIALVTSTQPPGALLEPTWACAADSVPNCTPAEDEGEVAVTLNLPPESQTHLALSAIAGQFDPALRVAAALMVPQDYEDADASDNSAEDTDIQPDLFRDGFEPAPTP